jgi:uncharacterized protein (TIGR02594 family)
MLPEPYYWISGPAIFLSLSFALTVLIGLVSMKKQTKRKLLVSGLVIALFGWLAIANQEKAADQRSTKSDEQYADLVLRMNRLIGVTPGAQLLALASDTPPWLKVAYGEMGQAEIPGPEENQRIVEYFKAIAAKRNYRDDIDDWASAFAEWSLNQVSLHGPKNDEPFEWLEWGLGLDKPVIGCIVILSFSGLHHVGFYFGEDVDFVHVLGGNEDDAVRIYRYPKNSVYGYRWPTNVVLPKR